MDDFILRALIGGIGVALICGPLGCLVIWQRMAYFGAALSHAALLGVALGLFMGISLYLAIVLVCALFSWLLSVMVRQGTTSDTALGILAHAALAVGILILSVMPSIRMDLMAYLFGDILSISWADIAWIYGGGIAIAGVLAKIWKPLLSLIVQRDLALVDGINEERIRLTFCVLISVAVAVAMQIVGVLLIVSLLIIPAATARRFAKGPEQMALLSIVFGMISIAVGLFVSMTFDTPAGPSIVGVASLIYLLAILIHTGPNKLVVNT